jgi:hypothetical protein
MNGRGIFLFCSLLFLSACVKAPVFKEGDYAFIRSNYPIINVNGVEAEPAYRLDIEAGENVLVIVYNTYQHDYFCTFSWTAVANTAYEVVDKENRYPLTLYRWVRTNSLWASRLDPADPLDCVQKPRR